MNDMIVDEDIDITDALDAEIGVVVSEDVAGTVTVDGVTLETPTTTEEAELLTVRSKIRLNVVSLPNVQSTVLTDAVPLSSCVCSTPPPRFAPIFA